MTELPEIPFSRPHRAAAEDRYVLDALAGGRTAGDGPYTRRAAALLGGLVGGGTALLTTSCTHALEMTALLLDLAPGDEVVVPSFTFVSTANAYALRGAVPVFADCRPDTLCLDPRAVEAAVTPRTRAIVAVHYGGVGSDLAALAKIAESAGATLVEDNAHGLGGGYGDRPLGAIGALSTLSFHATKNIQCGEGGALVLHDPALAARAEVIREKGTDRSRFFRGEVDRYRWQELGSSYLPSDILAAVLTAQLEEFGAIQARRHAIWDSYDRELADWAAGHGVARQRVPAESRHTAHLYALLLPDAAARAGLLAHLAAAGIRAATHYQPLHSSPAGLRYGRVGPGGCPVTTDVADRLLRLPLSADLTEADVARVVTAVRGFRPGPS
ncbi:dTDP-4-amino-4,6-dideoxy-D-glucose transaminase [Pilimelia terevasa]|uniref:dTDP-4-amino-4,6-dideoxy-D-glucose transaminase n=1 Tax=Pilimelia terevasa TaxID=53372 RepID=A0A8J3BTX7_9ACTN|nr:dTDP-4-amino-4,6-dideoxygalactose transaminase [Pilimelia terevasa]GGK40909.1 dTDP-4-amino-4,6-dideoxy-D-glucose transaminase [Pilimelia terevasa]